MGMSNEITHNFQNNFKKDNFFMASFSLRKDGMRRIKNPVCGDGKREFFFYCRAQARAQGDAPARGETGRKEDERGERKGRETAAANSDSSIKGRTGRKKPAGKGARKKARSAERALRIVFKFRFYAIAASFLASLDFLLAALFLWKSPSDAAPSMAETAAA